MQHRSAGRCPGDDPPQARVEKPRLAIPITLIVDDPAPCINPLYYYRLQVDGKNYERHARSIPFDSSNTLPASVRRMVFAASSASRPRA